jgi:hypothetical protein
MRGYCRCPLIRRYILMLNDQIVHKKGSLVCGSIEGGVFIQPVTGKVFSPKYMYAIYSKF